MIHFQVAAAKPYFARPYSRFALVYDAALGKRMFIGMRAAFEALVERYGINFRSAADIGCGTGLFAAYLSHCWEVPVFAVDRSREMLMMAARNCAGGNVCLLQQDISCLHLPSPVDLITANFDTVNHILHDVEIQETFRRVWENLTPGGHFIFDLITPCQPMRAGRTYRRRLGTGGCGAWQQLRWSPRQKTLSISVVICPRFQPFSVMEIHRERAYAPADVARWLMDAGFIIRGAHDAVTLRLATVCPPRIIVIARKTRSQRAPR